MKSRVVLVILFWVSLVVAVITISVPQAMKGGVWEEVTGFFQDGLASDMQKRDTAVRKSKKIVKGYVQTLKELYGTTFLMADDAADLAEKYAKIVRTPKNNSGSASGVMDSYVNELNKQASSLRELRGREAVELTDDMINRFRNLEQKLREQRSGQEVYQEQINKLAALKDRYASTLEKAMSQREKAMELNDKVRSLNERISTVARMNAENKERIAAIQERLISRTAAAQEKARSLQDELDAMNERQAAQKARMEALQERMNARMGR